MMTKEVSVGYLLHSINGRPRAVLMAVRQRGLGRGLYAPYGGELRPGEDPQRCLQRELREESRATCSLGDIEPVGSIDAFYKHRNLPKGGPSGDERIHIHVRIHLVHDWTGTPANTCRNEMRDPVFFPIHRLPVGHMLEGDLKTLRQVLLGRTVTAWAEYDLPTLRLVDFASSTVVVRLPFRR